MRARTGSTLLFLAACADGGASKSNGAPTATIIAPSDGGALAAGPVTLAGVVDDANHDASALTAAWLVDGVELCAAAAPAADGATGCTVELAPGSPEITLLVQDPEGATATDTVRVEIADHEAPIAEIRGPDAAARWYADDLISLSGWTSDADTPPEALVASWTSSLGGPLAVDLVPAGDGTVDAMVTLAAGEHGITFEVVDPEGKVGRDSLALMVGPANSAPGCGVLEPVDGEAFPVGAVLALRGFATDVDEPAEGLLVAWASDLDGPLGTAAPAADGAISFDASGLRPGTHQLSLTVTDERGARCADAVSVIVGSPPVVRIDAPMGGAVMNEGEPVTFSGLLTDPEDRPTDVAVEWESTLDGVLDSAPADGTGSLGFSALSLSRGDHIVTLRATDPSGLTGEDTVSFRVNGLPGGLSLRIDPVPARTGDDLVASVLSPATDPEGDPVSLVTSWTRNGAPTAYTGLSVPAAATSRGDRWELTATPADPYGVGTAATAAIVIENTAPQVTSLSLAPSAPRTDDTLVATATGADADGDVSSFNFAWDVDGAAVSSGGPSLSGAAYFSKGQVVGVTATPSDGTALGAPVRATVTIENTPPTAPRVAITPARPTPTDDLVCGIAAPSVDADGDAITYSVTWTVDGMEYPAEALDTGLVWEGPGTTTWVGDTVPAEDAALGGTWVCTMTPHDGDDPGPSGSATLSGMDACRGETVRVAMVDGWGSGWMDVNLAWSSIASNWSTYGDCALSFIDISRPFTAATLVAAAPDVVLIGDAGGGSVNYTTTELAAIESYVQGEGAGVVITYALIYTGYTANAPLARLAGLDPSMLNGSSRTISTQTTIVDSTHPIFVDVSTSPFNAVSFQREQGRSSTDWSPALLPGAAIIGGTTGQNTIIAYTGSSWRGVFVTGMMEYQNVGLDARQVLYNALMWSAGYGW